MEYEWTAGSETEPAGPAEAATNQTVISPPLCFNLLPFFLSKKEEGKPANSRRLQKKANRQRLSGVTTRAERERRIDCVTWDENPLCISVGRVLEDVQKGTFQKPIFFSQTLLSSAITLSYDGTSIAQLFNSSFCKSFSFKCGNKVFCLNIWQAKAISEDKTT